MGISGMVGMSGMYGMREMLMMSEPQAPADQNNNGNVSLLNFFFNKFLKFIFAHILHFIFR